MSLNPVDNAVIAVQLAVGQAEAAASLDIGAGEASVAVVTTQAAAAYQLVIEILQNGAVELAPALVALEIAAINQGIAAYLTEQTTASAIERAVQARAESATEEIAPAYQAFVQKDDAIYSTDLGLDQATSQADLKAVEPVSDAVRETLDRADAGVMAALKAVVGSDS